MLFAHYGVHRRRSRWRRLAALGRSADGLRSLDGLGLFHEKRTVEAPRTRVRDYERRKRAGRPHVTLAGAARRLAAFFVISMFFFAVSLCQWIAHGASSAGL